MENKTSIKIAHELFTYIRLHIELNTFLESVNYQVSKIEICLDNVWNLATFLIKLPLIRPGKGQVYSNAALSVHIGLSLEI